ncbi:MAG: nuclear transport factor 2 family protein [Pseudonocardia sp.]|uniref:nuclear transport factor 2 family protein n=1 Tax=Pseudonocardia sp. TaxID=60912 RepID=UPI001AD18E41|nr:nuclear transport factor 2 family protein [Pseudonocardia sp.]MBN9098639.1 nuclear transport factor 2 family protein [Pseudonocardia sp.]
MDLAELIARQEIGDVLVRYCRAVDRGDLELLLSVYHPDATDDHGMYSGNGHEFARWLLAQPGRDALVTQHHLTNTTLDLDGDPEIDTARAETYFVAVHRRPGPPVTVGQFGGRYLDRLERRAGVWRISARVVVHDWSLREIEGPEWGGLDAFARGAQAPDDPSHGLFA